jgi:hypothetical protein
VLLDQRPIRIDVDDPAADPASFGG